MSKQTATEAHRWLAVISDYELTQIEARWNSNQMRVRLVLERDPWVKRLLYGIAVKIHHVGYNGMLALFLDGSQLLVLGNRMRILDPVSPPKLLVWE